MAFDLLDFTKKLETQLDKEDLYITHVYIAYKVMMYYENNIGQITETVKPILIDNRLGKYMKYILKMMMLNS